MRRKGFFSSDNWIPVLIMGVPALAGFGLAQLNFSLPSSLAWPAVALVIIAVVAWFVYNIQVDGFIAKQAENKKKVQEMWDQYHDHKQLLAPKKEPK